MVWSSWFMCTIKSSKTLTEALEWDRKKIVQMFA